MMTSFDASWHPTSHEIQLLGIDDPNDQGNGGRIGVFSNRVLQEL